MVVALSRPVECSHLRSSGPPSVFLQGAPPVSPPLTLALSAQTLFSTDSKKGRFNRGLP